MYVRMYVYSVGNISRLILVRTFLTHRPCLCDKYRENTWPGPKKRKKRKKKKRKDCARLTRWMDRWIEVLTYLAS